uniref:Uncharacterized protein n=1 Tax=Erpetoichthys calabaricus TaxID=27687 RepID=A0A8C4X5K8_ERPCA
MILFPKLELYYHCYSHHQAAALLIYLLKKKGNCALNKEIPGNKANKHLLVFFSNVYTLLNWNGVLGVKTDLTSDLGNRSLSPWTYYLYNNADMFPSQIRMAKCTGNRCINSQFNSAAVNYTIQVYRRKECREGVYKLMLENFQVTVGCTSRCIL